MKKKITKENLLLLSGVIVFSLIMCNAFLQMHYSSDTYCLIYRGYFDYPSHYFLLDARLVSTLVSYLGGLLRLPYEVYIIGLDIIGVILLSISVVMLYRFMEQELKVKKILNKVLLLIATYVCIFNHITVEYLLYPESAIMCLGILTIVLAVIAYLSEDRNRYLKTFLLVLFSTLCYQGIVNLLPVLVITIVFIKNKDELTIKKTFKTYIAEMLKLGIMFIVVMLISYGISQIADKVIGETSSRLRTDKTLIGIIYYSKDVLIDQFNLLPKYLSVVVMGFTSIMLIIYSKNKLNMVIYYLLTVIAAYVFTLLPILAWGYVMARMAIVIGAVMGISLIFLVPLVKDDKEKIKNTIIIAFIVCYFIFNTINFIRNSNEHIVANKVDDNMGATISFLVKTYEEKSGNIINNFSFWYDPNPNKYAAGIKPLVSLTERKIMQSWCIVEATGFYCDKHFEKVFLMPDEIYNKYFKGKDDECFLEDQIVFEGDTMYLYVY